MESGADLPSEFRLSQNYPNPFNPSTTIRYDVPGAARVTLRVYDMLGREVAVLVDENKARGAYEVKWDGGTLATGVYLYRLTAGEFDHVRKMLLIK
jgi:predicted nucleotidyltransferase